MGRRSDHSRAELEALILAAGEAHLAEVGYAAFSAREVAKRVGYSVGTLYNLFGSYDRLVVALNARTLVAWTAFMRARLAAAPGDRLAALVSGYFAFAAQNRNRWMALYDHRVQSGFEMPAWFLDAFEGLSALLTQEVAGLRPDLDAAEARILTGSCAAIAHGHCMFWLNETFTLFGTWEPQAAALDRIRAAVGRPARDA